MPCLFCLQSLGFMSLKIFILLHNIPLCVDSYFTCSYSCCWCWSFHSFILKIPTLLCPFFWWLLGKNLGSRVGRSKAFDTLPGASQMCYICWCSHHWVCVCPVLTDKSGLTAHPRGLWLLCSGLLVLPRQGWCTDRSFRAGAGPHLIGTGCFLPIFFLVFIQ